MVRPSMAQPLPLFHAVEDAKRRTRPGERSGKRLLLVEDEEAILRPMSKYFRELGFSVVPARDVSEAEKALARASFDLLILDIRLEPSGRSGLDVLRTLRARESETPVVVMSAYVSQEVEQEALRLGARAVLRKPQPLANVARAAINLVGEP
jgi:CheY-like chemotaxis protein